MVIQRHDLEQDANYREVNCFRRCEKVTFNPRSSVTVGASILSTFGTSMTSAPAMRTISDNTTNVQAEQDNLNLGRPTLKEQRVVGAFKVPALDLERCDRFFDLAEDRFIALGIYHAD